LLVVIAGYIVLTRTNFGRHVYAIGGSQEAARLSGVNVASTKLGVYAIAGLLAGLSGFMLSAWVAAGDPKSGNMYEMNAIAAVVLGGTSLMGGSGSVAGTLLGALIIGSLQIGLDQTGVSTYYQMVVKGAVVLLAVVLDQLKIRMTQRSEYA
ncbi:MAG: ABC transporter permease, partial [Armatimonadota bacterium]|nr:ABC transporter permease [Armatimonadota bacterium]